MAEWQERLRRALGEARRELLAVRGPRGYWIGELSSSALSTATAVAALAVVERAGRGSGTASFKSQISAGLRWLAKNANADGGWGDTTLSVSNLSTTALAWAAFGVVPGADAENRKVVFAAREWIRTNAGGIDGEVLAPAIVRRYGKDRTFSAPILSMCALAGRLGEGPEAWRQVISLPFELAALPRSWFAALRLPVVSYALPALIAIGQARHFHCPTRNPVLRLLRQMTRDRTLRVLQEIQPADGGFLEATPLTSFVTMSLAGAGETNHPVVQKGVRFLLEAQRPDGSWPIDTNLATWVTTLAVNALGNGEGLQTQPAVRAWLLGQQYRRVHPYTQAAPGGWAWTDLPGGVPDADDTAGALRALRRLGAVDAGMREAVRAAVCWLLGLQNRDGGIPTFCRGWGTLPFDRSSPDLTAHALAAWQEWLGELPTGLASRVRGAIGRGLVYLCRTQRADGAWLPLWFGSQFAPDEGNPTYGTGRVLSALAGLGPEFRNFRGVGDAVAKGAAWLVSAQNAEGGWGGAGRCPASIEETGVAVEALARVLGRCGLDAQAMRSSLERGAQWLVERVERREWKQPAPIGFYFAKLWYYERLYPLIFCVGALREATGVLGEQ